MLMKHYLSPKIGDTFRVEQVKTTRISPAPGLEVFHAACLYREKKFNGLLTRKVHSHTNSVVSTNLRPNG